jgi:hypothetical protein
MPGSGDGSMSKFLALMAIVGFGAAIACLPTAAFAYGALAIDYNHGGSYGFAHDYPTMRSARSRALGECGGGCTVVVTFTRGCAAYSADQESGSTAYGWTSNVFSVGAAQSGAQAECRAHGGRACLVRVWGCE